MIEYIDQRVLLDVVKLLAPPGVFLQKRTLLNAGESQPPQTPRRCSQPAKFNRLLEVKSPESLLFKQYDL